jgi:glycosyltransferase involved in cell wall biosynthesis
MTAVPRISVIVPTYNRARDLARCLDSLVAQTFKDFEVLVCDDGSTDDTPQVVQRYAGKLDLTYHWAENFGGPARPRNVGLQKARGDYVAFLDSDDWWMPRKLEVSLAFLARGAELVYHNMYLVTSGGERRRRRKSVNRKLHSPVLEDLILNGNAIDTSSVVAARSLFQTIGGFAEDRNLIAAEDYDAWVRAARVTEAFVRIPETLGYYWVGQGNLSNPARTLINLDALEKRYADEIHKFAASRGVGWLSYLKARCHYLEGSLGEASANLSSIRWWRVPLAISARTLCMRVLIGYRKATERP